MRTKRKLPLLVMKFGGTSVGNAERLERVARYIADRVQETRSYLINARTLWKGQSLWNEIDEIEPNLWFRPQRSARLCGIHATKPFMR